MTLPETPLLTVDIIIELENRGIVLIERKNAPHGWALPGGFVDVGERLETAAVREAREETTLDVQLVSLLGCYSDPSRDQRGHTVSVVYVARASGQPQARDDAVNVALFDPHRCPKLVFDHREIINDYLSYLETGEPAPLRI